MAEEEAALAKRVRERATSSSQKPAAAFRKRPVELLQMGIRTAWSSVDAAILGSTVHFESSCAATLPSGRHYKARFP